MKALSRVLRKPSPLPDNFSSFLTPKTHEHMFCSMAKLTLF
jgi:hypothetical protein